MTPPRVFAAILLLSHFAAASRAAEPRYFDIRLNDKLIGYSSERVDREKWRGREVDRLRSSTVLKFAVLGKTRLTQLDSSTYIDPVKDRPVFFELKVAINDTISFVECEFGEQEARVWSFQKKESKGEATVVKLPPNATLLASNNFAHWRRMVAMLDPEKNPEEGQEKPEQEIAALSPEGKKVVKFRFQYHKPRYVQLLGKKTRCDVWRLPSEGVELCVAPKVGFVQMNLPAQNTKIQLTDAAVVKQAEKAAAEELLAGRFTESNVLFDDFAKVRFLKAEIDAKVIGSGVGNPPTILNTRMQTFEGEKKAERIKGVVTIRSKPFDGSNAPAFPYAGSDKDDLAQWLKPEQLIESDNPEIGARSKELIKGAKDSWQATRQIADWVHKEIRYTIADTPSARLCLEKREGDCGPHSTLTVAMLRAAGIPARLVGGLIYTPSYGGTFGQHAWVEVYMGPEAGWISIDPTTGESEAVSATHVKLFEGMGGATAESIKITAFDPPNKKSSPRIAKARPIAFKFDRDYTFNYVQRGKSIGKETFRLSRRKQDGKEIVELTSKSQLSVGSVVLKSDSKLGVADNALPISFHREMDVSGKKTVIKCEFKRGKVHANISGSVSLDRDLTVPVGAYCFDNNLMGCFALICSQLELRQEKEVVVTTFHPSTLQIIKLTLTPDAIEKVKIGDEDLECFRCQVAPIKNTFWITRDGRFVKASQGGLVIILEP